MRIICIGDIHMSAESISRIKNIATADLIIINGDLTNFGSWREARQVLDTIMAANPAVLAQFGNLDQPEINDYLEQQGINLHNQARLIDKRLCLIGVGGSNKTPFNTPSEFSEDELAAFLAYAHQQAREDQTLISSIEKINIPLILVTHAPPAGTAVDRLTSGSHVGSLAIRNFIAQQQPDLCVTGHIHEAAGMDHLGRTRIYNPGMLRLGGWLEIIFDSNILNTTLHDHF